MFSLLLLLLCWLLPSLFDRRSRRVVRWARSFSSFASVSCLGGMPRFAPSVRPAVRPPPSISSVRPRARARRVPPVVSYEAPHECRLVSTCLWCLTRHRTSADSCPFACGVLWGTARVPRDDVPPLRSGLLHRLRCTTARVRPRRQERLLRIPKPPTTGRRGRLRGGGGPAAAAAATATGGDDGGISAVATLVLVALVAVALVASGALVARRRCASGAAAAS